MRIVFIGDLHVGSRYSIFHPRWRNPESGIVLEGNDIQRKLYRYWAKWAEKLSPVDVMILMGDLVEGRQTREKHGTLIIQNLQEQALAAIDLLKMWKWKKLYVIRGTTYHVETSGVHVEEYIAEKLDAVKASRWGDRRSVIDLGLNLPSEKLSIHAAHHVGTSAIPHYQFTPIVREAWLAKMYDRYHGHYDIIARAHVHYFRIAQVSDDFLVFTTPCWQLPTPYQKRRSHFVFPDLGLVELETFGDGSYRLNSYLIHDIKPHREEVHLDG